MRIRFVIIGGLKLTGQKIRNPTLTSWWRRASSFASILFSYSAIRANTASAWQINFADRTFVVGGVFVLLTSMVVGPVFL